MHLVVLIQRMRRAETDSNFDCIFFDIWDISKNNVPCTMNGEFLKCFVQCSLLILSDYQALLTVQSVTLK